MEKIRSISYPKLGGRPAYDVVIVFKILVLQSLYNLSDEDRKYQIADRLSFQKFLGIEPDGAVPDSNTIWLFREKLKERELDKPLFQRFERFLQSNGFRATPANERDSRHFEELLDRRGASRKIFDDAGYAVKKHFDRLIKMGFSPLICESSYRDRPLTEE